MSVTPRHTRAAQSVLQTPACQCQHSLKPLAQRRSFHASKQHNLRTRMRREMDQWFAGDLAKALKTQLPGSTNYLSAYNQQGKLMRLLRRDRNKDRDEDSPTGRVGDEKADEERGIPRENVRDLHPYPLNPHFRSQSVLPEEMREEIYQQVVVNGIDITTISATHGVDIRRVAAVVRLKTIEKQWLAEGKKLATPYNNAVLGMLPQTPYSLRKPGNVVRHESINDLPVHSATRTQLFWPASESRHFTRVDAAKAFSKSLLPADKRIAHPELIELERWNVQGLSKEERIAKLRARDAEQQAAKKKQEDAQRLWEKNTQRVVPGRRWDFKFQDISVEKAGANGRGEDGVGLRYGYAHIDRKRGISKIPTSVE